MRSRLVEVYAQERAGRARCSIVVPVYNGARFLDAAIASVLGQTGVICEIVISDDYSEDGSLEAILTAVRRYTGPHSIRVFRTSQPAASENLPLLVAASRTDRIIVAHQDDTSDPDRARMLARMLTGKTMLATSVARVNSGGAVSVPSPAALQALRNHDNFRNFVMSGRGVMIGAHYGMHRDLFRRFPELSFDYLSHGHDILLPIRAKMLGACKVVYRPLLTVGDHPDRGSYRLFDRQDPATRDFDYALRRIVVISVALDELTHLRAVGGIGGARADRIKKRLEDGRSAFLGALVRNRELAILRGFRLTWEKRQTRM
jgi:hypothetical protein